MAKIANARTGSRAFTSNYNNNHIGFFKDDTRYTFISQKADVTGCILPAFDPTYSESDPARMTSYCSYREPYTTDENSTNGDFTPWMVFYDVYTFFGRAWNMIISPAANGMVDPITELRINIFRRRKEEGDTTYLYLADAKMKKSKDDKLALPGSVTMGFCNAYCNTLRPKDNDDRCEMNRVLILGPTASQKVYDDLNIVRPITMSIPVDEHNPKYLYGDITTPSAAIRFHTGTMKLTGGNVASCLNFGTLRNDILNPERMVITQQMLQNRIDLDDSKYMYIPTTEEIVDLLIEEGNVPYDLIAEVCSDNYKGAFPKRPANAKAYPAPAPANKEAAYQQPAGYAPSAAQTYQQPAPQPVYSQPVQQPVYSQPVQQQAPVYQHPQYQQQVQQKPAVLADDPNDNIPMGNQPAEAPQTVNALTPAEEAELQQLAAKLGDPSNVDISMDVINRYSKLKSRKAGTKA